MDKNISLIKETIFIMKMWKYYLGCYTVIYLLFSPSLSSETEDCFLSLNSRILAIRHFLKKLIAFTIIGEYKLIKSQSVWKCQIHTVWPLQTEFFIN